jgi:transcriptional regulator
VTTPAARFAPPSEAEVTRLVLEHPLAWVISMSADDYCATSLPLRPVLDSDGGVEQFLGHFARSNGHLELVRRQPRALLLFRGPHGYVSPSWFTDRTQAPTWNYASAQYVVDITLLESEGELDEVLRDLIGAMEAGRPNAWNAAEMGPRYRRLASGIVAFRARIVERRAKYKLGQDERDDVYAEILRALEANGSTELSEWMRRANPDRGSR